MHPDVQPDEKFSPYETLYRQARIRGFRAVTALGVRCNARGAPVRARLRLPSTAGVLDAL